MRSLFSREELSIPRWMMNLCGQVNVDSIKELREDNKEYQSLCREIEELEKQYPVLEKLLNDFGAVRLNKKEQWAFHRYMELKYGLEQLERQQIYLYGYVHCYECLKKMGALSVNEDA